MRKSILNLSACVLALVCAQPSFSADAEGEPDDGAASTKSDTQESASSPPPAPHDKSDGKSVAKNDAKENEAEKSPEVFLPSEDISEDIAVSFPVDI